MELANRIFTITCVKNINKDNIEYYTFFGIHPKLISVYGKTLDDILEVTFKISSNQNIYNNNLQNKQQDKPDYWGFFDFKKNNFASYIQPSLSMLDMCFPYGYKEYIKDNIGMIYRLEFLTEKKYEQLSKNNK